MNHRCTCSILPLCILLVAFAFFTGCISADTAKIANTDAKTPLSITFFNVGQGDSCLLQAEGKTMLIDAGPREAGPIIADWLRSRNITTLDIVVATHPHSDHIGGMPYLLKSFRIGKVIDNGDTHTTPTYEQFLKAVEKQHIPLSSAKTGDTIALFPHLTIEVLSPELPLGDDVNDNSIVLRISGGKSTLLLMGDAGQGIEERLMKQGVRLKADLLKVGHHGSRHSSGKRFITEVSPDIAIISLAPDNEYGYPQRDPIRYLTDISAKIYRTDQAGTITVKSDGSDYSVIPGDEIQDRGVCSCQGIRDFCAGPAGRLNPCCAACGG